MNIPANESQDGAGNWEKLRVYTQMQIHKFGIEQEFLLAHLEVQHKKLREVDGLGEGDELVAGQDQLLQGGTSTQS